MTCYTNPDGTTITIEFYNDSSKRMHVIYNNRDYLLADFWKKNNDAERMFRIIHDEFRMQFPARFKKAASLSKGWQETFLKILNNNLRLKDDRLDIIIRASGDIIFNLEF